MPDQSTVPPLEFLTDGPADATWSLCLAHGAGAPMDSPFMDAMAAQLAGEGIRVLRFEFPYMRRRRAEGTRRPPDRQPVLLESWQEVYRELAQAIGPGRRLAIGGKSMGGRMASLIADQVNADALVCLGYPFHPPGKPEKLRTEHLVDLKTPSLICQGERDPFGGREEVEGYALSPRIHLFWAADGNHDLKPRKLSGHTHEGHIASAARRVAEFLNALPI